MDLNSALDRIAFRGRRHASYDTLRELQRAFLLAVPFENLDIHLGRRIGITPEAVYRKVIEQRRGGFCFELNSLFHDLLFELGFEVKFLAARMMRDGRPGTPMGHMVLRVDVDGAAWLTDVGNGKSAREPLNFDGSNTTTAEGISFRVGESEPGLALLETDDDGNWQPRFIIDPQPRRRDEFHAVCDWTQTSPESIFTQRRACTLARPDGRVLLMNNQLTITERDKIEERLVRDDEYEKTLQELFGIQI
jgi:N-hydroxyarylamine O-acetyltransferase